MRRNDRMVKNRLIKIRKILDETFDIADDRKCYTLLFSLHFIRSLVDDVIERDMKKYYEK